MVDAQTPGVPTTAAASCPDGRPSPAALDAAADARARTIFESGKAAFLDARYAQAIEAFERVFHMTGHPMMLINIGNAWAKLQESERAISAYRQYLAIAAEDDPHRADVRTRVSELQAALAAAAARPPATPADVDAKSARGLWRGRTYTWLAAGTGVLALGATAWLWNAADARYVALRDSCGEQGCRASQIQAVDSRMTAGNVMLVLAGLSLGAAVGLWFVEAPEQPTADAGHLHVEVGAGGASVRGAF